MTVFTGETPFDDGNQELSEAVSVYIRSIGVLNISVVTETYAAVLINNAGMDLISSTMILLDRSKEESLF